MHGPTFAMIRRMTGSRLRCSMAASHRSSGGTWGNHMAAGISERASAPAAEAGVRAVDGVAEGARLAVEHHRVPTRLRGRDRKHDEHEQADDEPEAKDAPTIGGFDGHCPSIRPPPGQVVKSNYGSLRHPAELRKGPRRDGRRGH